MHDGLETRKCDDYSLGKDPTSRSELQAHQIPALMQWLHLWLLGHSITPLSTVSVPYNTWSLFGEHTSAVVLYSPIRWTTSCWLHAWHLEAPGKELITDGMNKGGGLIKRNGLYGSTTSVLKQKSCESYSQGYDFLNCVLSASLSKMEEGKIDSNQIWRKPRRRIIRGRRVRTQV